MTPRSLLAAALLPLAALAAACTSDPAPATPTPTETAAATATPEVRETPRPRPTVAPTATATAPDPALPTNGVTLVDVEAGQARTLYEGPRFGYVQGYEEDGGVWVLVSDEDRSLRFDAAGALVEEVPGYGPARDERCREIGVPGQPRSIIDGREYDTPCGLISPDDRYMYYTLAPPGADEWTYAGWLLDLGTGGVAMLTDELRDCGGCDYRAGPAWSPSGRYIMFGELFAGEDSTAYVTDVETGETRRIARGQYVNSLRFEPVWSPAEDAFLALSDEGGTRLERLRSGEAIDLADVPWPARWDDTGAYVYSFAVPGSVPPAEGETTVIADAATGEVVERWSGRPQTWPVERGIAAVDGQPAALLEQSEDCPGGIAVRMASLAGGVTCIDGRGATWDPGHARVAFAREPNPDDDDPFGRTWDIVVLDLASGDERVLADGIRSSYDVPPLIRWDAAGTRLLVQWPSPEVIW